MNVNNNEVLLGDLAVLYDSLHKTPKTYIEDGYPMIRVTDIERGSVRTEGTMRVDEKIYEEFSKKHKPIIGDTILTRVGSYGNSAIVADDEPFCLGQNTVCISPIREKVHPYYLYYCLNSRFVLSQFDSFITGASQPTISLKSIRTVRLQLPRMETQRRISKILSTYDNLIENNRRRIQLLEQSARLLYKEWFVHLRFPGHEHVKIKDGVPEGWETGTIGDLGNIVTGKTPSKKKAENYGHVMPFIKTPDMHGNVIVVHAEEALSEEGAKTQANKTLPSRSILVSCIGTVGAVAFNASPAQTNQQINSIVPVNDSITYWAFFMAKNLGSSPDRVGRLLYIDERQRAIQTDIGHSDAVGGV